MSINLKVINEEKVNPIKMPKDDKYLALGHELFPKKYGNIFICSKQGSGKTTVINKIIEDCTDKDTQLFVFCSNHNTDSAWEAIKKMVEKRDMFAEFFTSVIDDDCGVNELEMIMKDFQNEEKEEDCEDEELEKDIYIKTTHCHRYISVKIKKPKEKKKKFIAPKMLFIFDDLSHELSNKWIQKLMKEPRHFKAKVIISSQYLNDLTPGQRQQINYWLVFQGQPLEKLEAIYLNSLMSMGFEKFEQIYRLVTGEKYHFLYIDRDISQLRKDFNTLIELK